ncbi:MAG: CheY-like chemotaxis protein, partial [Planctomycetota bacterium]
GYVVELAFDGRQVLERLENDPLPDLVLLDYSMPELNGQEVIQRVHENPRSCNVPILLATATSIDLANVQRTNGLLRKPYPRDVLFAMIERLLAESSGS